MKHWIWIFPLVIVEVVLIMVAVNLSGVSAPHKPSLIHQQDSLLARIVTLDSLLYELNEKESQKPIVYGRTGYDRAYFREWDTLHADRRHTTNRLNVINARVNNK